MNAKRTALIAGGIAIAPFIFYGWCAAIGKFLNVLDKWVHP